MIYAISDEWGRVKIGIARDPSGRVRDLQTGNAGVLTLIGAAATGGCDGNVEGHLHDMLGRLGLRLSGEWFEPNIITTVVANFIANDDAQSAINFVSDHSMWRVPFGEAIKGILAEVEFTRARLSPAPTSAPASDRRAYKREWMRNSRAKAAK